MSDNKYKFGIVGAGMIAEFHARAIQSMKGVELVAVYARRHEQAQEFSERYGVHGYSDYRNFLKHQGLDVVTICSVSGVHLDHVSLAAKSGKHIICEKPIEVTTERIDQMMAVCEENRVSLAGIFPRRFNDSTHLFKKVILEGRLGKIVLADASIKWWRTQEYYESSAWRGTMKWDGGGALMNQGIHTIDLLLYLMGEVRSVCAYSGLLAHEGLEVEDIAVAILEFKNGAKGVIQGSTACYSKEGHPASVQICGDSGSVTMVDDKFSVWDFKDESISDKEVLLKYGLKGISGGAGAADPSAIDYLWHQRNFEDIVDALREGKKPLVDGAEARKSVALISAIYESANGRGKRIVLS